MVTGVQTCALPIYWSSDVCSSDLQWQLQLPVAGATSGALGLRLTQSGAGEWQVRLHASASLRQQLQPHIGRLRQQLSQHGSHLEEDMGPEEEA